MPCSASPSLISCIIGKRYARVLPDPVWEAMVKSEERSVRMAWTAVTWISVGSERPFSSNAARRSGESPRSLNVFLGLGSAGGGDGGDFDDDDDDEGGLSLPLPLCDGGEEEGVAWQTTTEMTGREER